MKLDIPVKKGGRPSQKPDDKQLIELYSYLNSTEIAKLFDVPASAVRGWLHRLRKEQAENGG